jgi:hypothetical protein
LETAVEYLAAGGLEDAAPPLVIRAMVVGVDIRADGTPAIIGKGNAGLGCQAQQYKTSEQAAVTSVV